MEKSCSQCGAPFNCGVSGKAQPCWCASLPAVMPVDGGADCECPECLPRTIGALLEALGTSADVATMVEAAAPYRGSALIEHIDFEIEDGKYVFTRWFHLKRGSCCGNGCRHCPFDHINVPS